ncbi:MAG: hypothetical protein IKU58_09680, partial [Clostridia bacterium]|nr:hypothetical protein [Clostridia bacterium]
MTQQTKGRSRVVRQLAAALLAGVFTLARPAEGMAPFGLAFLSVGAHPLPAAAGVFAAGMAGGRAGLVYGAAAMVVLACRMVLEGTATARVKAFFPGCAALALVLVKGVVVLSEGGRAVLLLLCEGALCLGFGMLLGESGDDRSPLQLWGKLSAFLALLLALLPVELWGGFSLSGAGGAFAVLLAGAFGGGTVGACVGAVLGAALDVARGYLPQRTLIWCLTGLCAGL